MQGHKASDRTRQDLKQWLEKPTTSAGASVGAKDDIRWLESSKDLSAIDVSGEEKGEKVGKAPSQKQGGGFGALFGCAGRRK